MSVGQALEALSLIARWMGTTGTNEWKGSTLGGVDGHEEGHVACFWEETQ